MRVAIHQPQYLPWLGYLAKWAAADLFIVLDVVQYQKHGWQNRNRIKTREGARWLTVPVHASLGEPISAITIDRSQQWPARHLRAIEHAYARAPALAAYRDELRRFYATAWTRLAPLATDSARWLAHAFGISTPLRMASEFSDSLAAASTPTARLVTLCRAAGADTYLAGEHGGAYMDLAEFAAAGIGVLAQRYEHPMYPQVHGEFVSHLSALDLLLTVGEGAFAILRAGDRWTRLLKPRP